MDYRLLVKVIWEERSVYYEGFATTSQFTGAFKII
jgi:hypothetical protein